MRKSWLTLASTLASLGLAGPAAGVPTAFTGTLSVTVGAATTFTPIATLTLAVNGSADVTFSGGSIASLSLAGGTFSSSATIPVTDPALSPITQVAINVTNAAGSFGSIPAGSITLVGSSFSGSGSGTMGLAGLAKLGLFAVPPVANLSVPFTSGGVNGMGLGGAPVTLTSAGGASVTVIGAPWTTGTASIGSATVSGFVAGNSVQLVTPTFISSSVADSHFTAFSVLTLTFAPEPGTLLLLSGGLAALGLVSRRGRGARDRAAGSPAAGSAGRGSAPACSAGRR